MVGKLGGPNWKVRISERDRERVMVMVGQEESDEISQGSWLSRSSWATVGCDQAWQWDF